MAKNVELEERIEAIENDLRLKDEAAIDAAMEEEIAALPNATPPLENKEDVSVAGKSTRLGFIEKRLDMLETGGKRSKSKMSH